MGLRLVRLTVEVFVKFLGEDETFDLRIALEFLKMTEQVLDITDRCTRRWRGESVDSRAPDGMETENHLRHLRCCLQHRGDCGKPLASRPARDLTAPARSAAIF
jgi:hypothetical protein